MKISAGTKGNWRSYKDKFEKKDVSLPGSSRLGRMFGVYGKAVFKLSNWILSWLWSILAPIVFTLPAVVILVMVIALLIFDAILKFQIQLYWQLGNEAISKFGKIIGGMLGYYLKGLALIMKSLLDSFAWTAKMTVKGVLYGVSGATTALSGVALDWIQGEGAILGKYDLIGNNLDQETVNQMEEDHEKKVVEITYTEDQNFEMDAKKQLEEHEKLADMLQYSFRFGKYWEQALATGLVRQNQLETYYNLVNGESDTPTTSLVNNLVQNSENKAGQIKDVYYWRYKEALLEKERLEKEVRKKELNIVSISKKSNEEIDNEIQDKENKKAELETKIGYIDNEIQDLEAKKEQDQQNTNKEVSDIIDKYKQAVENTSDKEIKEAVGDNINKEQLLSNISTPSGVRTMIEQQVEQLEEQYNESAEKREELETKFNDMDYDTIQMLYTLLMEEAGEIQKGAKTYVGEEETETLEEDSEETSKPAEFDEKKFKEENDYEGFKDLIRIIDLENMIQSSNDELGVLNEYLSDVDATDKEIQDKNLEKEKLILEIEDLDYDIKDLIAYKNAGSLSVNEDEGLRKAKENLKLAKEKLFGVYMEDNLLYAIEDDGEFSNESKVNYIMELYYEDDEIYPELKESMPTALDQEINRMENTFNRFVGGASGFDNMSIDEALNAIVQKKYGGYGYPKSYYTKKTADNENVVGARVYTYEETAITAPENLKLVRAYLDYEPIERGQKVLCMDFVSEDGAREYKIMGIEEISRIFTAKAKQDYELSPDNGEFNEIDIEELQYGERNFTYDHIIIPEGMVIGTFGKNIVPLLERRKAEDLQNKIRQEEININTIIENETENDDYYNMQDEDGVTNEEKIDMAKENIKAYRQELEEIKKGDMYDYIFVELNEDSTNSVLDVEPDFIIPVYEKGKYRFAVTKRERENSLGSRLYGGAILAENSGSVQNIGYGEDGLSMVVKYVNGNTKTYTESDDNIIAFGDTTKALLNSLDPYWNSKYYVFDDEIEVNKDEYLGTIPRETDANDSIGVYANSNYKIYNVTFGGSRDDIKSFELLDIKDKKIVTYKVISSKSGRYGGQEIQKLSEAMKNKLKNYDKYKIMRGEQIGSNIEYEVVDKSNTDGVRQTSLVRSINEVNYENEGYCEILEVGRDDNGLLKIKLRTMPDYKIKEYVGLISVGSKVKDKLSNVFNRYNDNYSATTDKDIYNKDYIYSYAKWNEKYYNVEGELNRKKAMKEYLGKDTTIDSEEENKIAAYEAIAFKGRVIKGTEDELYFDDLGEETEIIAPENCILTGAGWTSDTGYTLQLTSLDYERRYTFSELNSFSSWITGVLESKLGSNWKESGKFEEINEYRIIEKGEKIGRMGASKGPNAGNIPMIARETLRVTKFGRIKENGEEKYCVTLESLDGERVYEIEDMDILSQMANTGIKGDLRKSNVQVKLPYREVDYNDCYMLTDEEVKEKQLYKKAYVADYITPGSSVTKDLDATYGKGYGIRPLYIYEGELIGYVKMKKIQDTIQRYAMGSESNKLQTKIKVSSNSFDGYNKNGQSSDMIIRRKAKVNDLFDAVHVNVSIEKFDNLLPESFEETITSRIVKIQNIERTAEGFNLTYREGNHRVDKVVCYNNKGEVIATNELVYASGNKRIDKIEYYKDDKNSSKQKDLSRDDKYIRTKTKDQATNSDVIELTIPIVVTDGYDNVAKIVVYDSIGSSVNYSITGVSKVSQKDGLTTVTAVAPKDIGIRKVELYDSDKNLIKAKDVAYKDRNEMNFDIETSKDVYQVKIYGYDGSTIVWKPEVTYVNKVDDNTIKLEFIKGMKDIEKIEYYDSFGDAVKLDDDDKITRVSGNKYEVISKVPDAYDIKRVVIYDEDGTYTEYQCLDIEDIEFVDDTIIDISVVVDPNDGVKAIELYDYDENLIVRERETNQNETNYSIDVAGFDLESYDIGEVRVYSNNGEIAYYSMYDQYNEDDAEYDYAE